MGLNAFILEVGEFVLVLCYRPYILEILEYAQKHPKTLLESLSPYILDMAPPRFESGRPSRRAFLGYFSSVLDACFNLISRVSMVAHLSVLSFSPTHTPRIAPLVVYVLVQTTGLGLMTGARMKESAKEAHVQKQQQPSACL